MTKPTWDKFVAVTPHRDGVALELPEGETYWQNRFYTVVKKRLQETEEGALHLSIRHNQRKAIRDWRHFQRIKNELAGPEREAIEIFPPESNLIDTANQYHLFVYPEGMHSEFTWTQGRMVSSTPDAPEVREWVQSHGEDPNNLVGAVQRPLDEE